MIYLYFSIQELYVFNRYGQHVATKNIITDQYVYNFTYNVNSYYGKLVKVYIKIKFSLEILINNKRNISKDFELEPWWKAENCRYSSLKKPL